MLAPVRLSVRLSHGWISQNVEVTVMQFITTQYLSLLRVMFHEKFYRVPRRGRRRRESGKNKLLSSFMRQCLENSTLYVQSYLLLKINTMLHNYTLSIGTSLFFCCLYDKLFLVKRTFSLPLTIMHCSARFVPSEALKSIMVIGV